VITSNAHRPPTWLLLVLSGVILGLAYPPNPIGLFGSVGLVPLLLALERADSWRKLLRWSYLSLLIFSALSSWWIGSWQAKADPFLMISCVLLVLVHPLFFMVPLVAYRWVRLRRGRFFALAFLPFLWCGGEFLHALTDASYPWLTLGNTQTYNLYYIQFIEFTGVWGLSFLLLVQNCAFAAMIFSLGFESRHQTRMFRTGMTIIALTLVPPFLYGFYVLGEAADAPPSKTITVTVVQPNVDPWDKWNQADTTDHIALNFRLSAASPLSRATQMFLWSENAIPYPLTQPGNEARREAMSVAVATLGRPVMTGFPDYVVYGPGDQPPVTSRPGVTVNTTTGALDTTFRWDYFNSVGLWTPEQGLTGAYHKMQLVPFGERIPFADDVPFLTGLLSWDVGISSWAKGKSIATFDVPIGDTITRSASVICFESIYPNIVRQFIDSGANFMTIITNDGWYMGTPGPLQHNRIAIMRAIETRRAIARAANTGISSFITPYGSIFNETEEGVATTTTGAIALRDDRTLYVRWGDWWPILCLIASGAMMLYAGASRTREEHVADEAEAHSDITQSR
jgi:apolipoprotein N-acyltransferase